MILFNVEIRRHPHECFFHTNYCLKVIIEFSSGIRKYCILRLALIFFRFFKANLTLLSRQAVPSDGSRNQQILCPSRTNFDNSDILISLDIIAKTKTLFF